MMEKDRARSLTIYRNRSGHFEANTKPLPIPHARIGQYTADGSLKCLTGIVSVHLPP